MQFRGEKEKVVSCCMYDNWEVDVLTFFCGCPGFHSAIWRAFIRQLGAISFGNLAKFYSATWQCDSPVKNDFARPLVGARRNIISFRSFDLGVFLFSFCRKKLSSAIDERIRDLLLEEGIIGVNESHPADSVPLPRRHWR